jgi:transposase
MRSVTRSYRIRAYPNGAQRRLLERWFGASRWLWNTTLAIRSEAYRLFGLKLTGDDLSRWLTQWKRTAGHEWLAAVPATCLTQCLHDQDAAFRNFFAHRARYPKFKRKSAAASLRFQGVGAAWARGVARLGRSTLGSDSASLSDPNFGRLTEDLNVKAMARGMHSRAVHDAAFSEFRRQLTYKADWYGKILETVDRWFPSSKKCSECRYIRDELRLDERQWTCPKCGTCHDRDINAARNLLAEGLRQLAGRDDRDLRVDAGDACPEEDLLAQVLADEARSGHRNRACLEQARFS